MYILAHGVFLDNGAEVSKTLYINLHICDRMTITRSQDNILFDLQMSEKAPDLTKKAALTSSMPVPDIDG